MKPAQLLSAVLACTSFVAAWPGQDLLSNGGALDIRGLLMPHKRQAITLGNADAAATTSGGSSAAATTGASSAAATSGGSSAAATSGGSSAAATSDGSAAATTGGSAAKTTAASTGKGSSKTTGSHKTTAIDPRLPAGGISVITPNVMSSTQYYKVGDYVTFGWNYTSLSVTPSAIDILASCSINQATYTLAMNQSVSASTGAITWDTGHYQSTATISLLTGTYTLIIHDAAKDVSATAAAGYLGTYDTFTFGMYTPQPYVPFDEYVCATCSGAMSAMERQTLGFLFAMVGITIASFTWFAGGAGILY